MTEFGQVERGRLICKCGSKERPQLIERGYYRLHHARNIEKDLITARGGGPEDFSAHGSEYFLECVDCGAEYPLPEGMEIEWV